MASCLDEHVDSLSQLLYLLNLRLQPLDTLMQGLQHLQNNEVVLLKM